MPKDGLPFWIDGEMTCDQFGKFFRHVAPHAVIARERRLRSIDIKTGTKPEIVGTGGITGHTFAAWAGIRRDKDQAQLGACLPKFTLLRDIGVGAGETRQIPDHWKLRIILMRSALFSMRPYICVPQALDAWRWIVAEASTTLSLSPFSSTVTVSRGTTAITAKVAPSGFQHLVQPQAWLWATSPLTPTLTGLSLHLQTRVPPAKLPEPFFTPLSTDGWI